MAIEPARADSTPLPFISTAIYAPPPTENSEGWHQGEGMRKMIVSSRSRTTVESRGKVDEWQRVGRMIFAAVVLLILPGLALADYPPLQSVDDNAHFSNGVIRHHRYDDINLYTRSLHGLSYAMGPLELQYDEAYPSSGAYSSDRAGNFDLKSVTFQEGITVGFPRVAGNWLYDGTQRYALGAARPSGSQPGFGNYTYRTLVRGGRYVAVDIGLLGGEVHDLDAQIAYGLQLFNLDGTWVPEHARTSSDHRVEYSWNTSLSQVGLPLPASVRLLKRGIELERLEFDWQSGSPRPRLTRVRSYLNGQPAPWRWVWVGYENTALQPLTIVNRIFVGADSSGPLQAGLVPQGVRLFYQTAGDKNVITRVENYQSKQLKQYLLTQVLVGPNEVQRTVYSGIRTGSSAQAATTIAYPSPTVNRRRVVITSPQRPNDPVSMELDSDIGTLVRMSRASCPQPLYDAVYSAGGPSHGYLEFEYLRNRCDSLLTRRYFYSSLGFLERIETTGRGSDGVETTRTATFGTKSTLTASGVRSYVLTSLTDPYGRTDTWDYDPEGRLISESSTEPGNNVTTSYEFWDAPNDNVRSVTRRYPNGREERVDYAQNGLLQQASDAVGSTQEITRSFSYDSFLRLDTVVDERSNTWTFEYLPNGYLDTMTTVSSTGAESLTSALSYHPQFPGVVARQDTIAERAGNTQSSFTQYTFMPNLPIPTKLEVGGDGTSTLTAWSMQYDPATLRLQRACVRPSGSSDAGCDQFYFRTDGVFSGLPAYVDVAGGIAAGGYRKSYLYTAHADLTGRRIKDSEVDFTITESYDDFERLREVTTIGLSGQHEVLRYEFDLNDRLLRQRKFIDGSLTSDLRQGFMQAGGSDRPSYFEDIVSGLRTDYAYNDPHGRLTSATTMIGGTRTQEQYSVDPGSFDLFNRPRSFSRFLDGAGVVTWQSSINALGDLKSITDERGNTTQYSYDSFGRPTRILAQLYDTTISYPITSGRRVERVTTTERSTNAALRTPEVQDTHRDALGRVVRLHNVTRGSEIYVYYNQRGLPSSTVGYYPDAPSQWVDFEYDGFGRLIRHLLSGTRLFERSFSGIGLLLSYKDAHSNTTTFSYDHYGRRTAIHYPDGSQETFSAPQYIWPPQANGETLRLQWTDRAGAAYTGKFDAFGQALSVTINGGPRGNASRSYTYDGLRLGSVTTQTVDGTSLLEFDFDPIGRPIREMTEVSSPLSSFSFALAKSYDSYGKLTSYTYPSNPSYNVSYIRDQFGRVTQIRVNGSPLSTYTFDGPVLTSQSLGDITRSIEYAPGTGDPARILDRRAGSTIADLRFEFDSLGLLRSRRDYGLRRGNLPFTSETFEYNDLGMLENVQVSQPIGGSGTRNFDPEPDGILGLLADTNEMFEMPTAFTYDPYGAPLSGLSRPLTFSWSPFGLRSFRYGAITSHHLQDGIGRNVWYSLGSSGSDVTQVRDRGMVLYQRETGW